ncbi:hypothetical protein GETHLI_33190 [Geothrix limicola]|uniref:DUF3373 domain-containing protein n=1 Tax=Geothrix limicola TaxID=2927978 RepID=A0ABQ5QJF0_9BACT|nr:DUF3373 family protein [Geothrix limicola]GLH74817.1 hypothetical protein GETHLI_33190 [Geothrix limicola]
MHSRLTLALVAMLAPAALSAQSNEDLQKQIEQLKTQLKAVEEKATAAQEIDTRLVKVETKVAGDNIQWGGELRTRFDSAQEHFKPYMPFYGFMQTPSGPAAGMPMVVPAPMVPAQDWTNSVQWSTRLRLNMGITINENAKIMGRLTMYKVHGGADVPTFNGTPNTISTSFTAGQTPATDALLVERASLVYHFPAVASILSIGRQNTSDGPPFEVREGGERQATPQALAVNATIDGIGWKFQLDKLGLPENTLLGFCYGVGYESGFGGGGSVKTNQTIVGMNFTNFNGTNPSAITPVVGNIGPLKDTTVLGAMFDMPLLFQIGESVQSANLYLGYNRMGNMTDIPFGNTINFPIPGQTPSTQYVTATANLGDMDQMTATWKHKIGDTFTYFVSGGYLKSHPNGQVSQYGAYWTFPSAMPAGYPTGLTQLSGFGGLMGDPTKSQTATAYYAGMRYDPTTDIGFGVEFNHGSPRWWTYTPATGEYTDKLGARGDVWEAYIHWKFAHHAALRLGYIDYKYTTAMSGWQIGPSAQPGQNWETAMNLSNTPMLQYAYPATVKNLYASIEVKF